MTRVPDLPPPFGISDCQNGSATFAIPVSRDAVQVEFCSFGDAGAEYRIRLTNSLAGTWWGTVPAVPGDRYGIRVTNATDQKNISAPSGSEKLLVDPWAHAIDGDVNWLADPNAMRAGSTTDSAPFMPRSLVVDDRFDWGTSTKPNTPWSDTVLYEMHVRGATKLHPEIAPELRGTYAGVAHPAFIAHLKRVGVTAVELLPIHHAVSEERLAHLGLSNYWGYNTLGYLAPAQRYGSKRSGAGASADLDRAARIDHVSECKGMIKLLHEAGIEVILDVVYNHTCEAGANGGVLSWRGLNPVGWYRRDDVTGCGNTVDLNQPTALALALDSLRHWVTEYQIDGFRFDLAPALGRMPSGDFSAQSAFVLAVGADPVLRSVKLIAEPWDIGPGGYQLGSFPSPWAEWNDRYRDLVRDHWRGQAPLGALARRISGAPDVFQFTNRRPFSSVNFITSHDGFTLRDLVSYNDRQNHANGEGGRDGSSDNRSNNHGVEGPTTDQSVLDARMRTTRAMLATLFVSQGTPMLLGGDEFGRTQQGNNNAYCQDNELSWFDWSSADESLIAFVGALSKLRKQFRALRQDSWLTPSSARWFSPAGAPMNIERWDDPNASGLAVVLQPESLPAAGGHSSSHEPVLLILNDGEGQIFTVPTPSLLPSGRGSWRAVFVSDGGLGREAGGKVEGDATSTVIGADNRVAIPAQSVVLFVMDEPEHT